MYTCVLITHEILPCIVSCPFLFCPVLSCPASALLTPQTLFDINQKVYLLEEKLKQSFSFCLTLPYQNPKYASSVASAKELYGMSKDHMTSTEAHVH